MNKRGVSSVIAMVLIILAVVLAATLIWIALFPMLDSWLYSEKVTTVLLDERISIPYAGPGDDDTTLDVIIDRGSSELLELQIENVTKTVNRTIFVPTDMLLLTDLSGSMGGTKLATLNSSTEVLINSLFNLNEESRLAIMGFSYITYPYIQFPGTPYEVTRYRQFHDFSDNPSDLINFMHNVHLESPTYLLPGMEAAYDEFSSSVADEKVLVVLSDGQTMDSNDDAYTWAQKFKDDGINVHTIGFGTGADVTFLTNLATNGGGFYYSSADIADLAEVYRSLLEEVNITYEIQYEVSIPGVFIDLVIYSGGDSYTHRIEGAVPGSNEQKRYQIPLKDGWKASEITKIKVYIVAISRGGVENSVLLGTHKI